MEKVVELTEEFVDPWSVELGAPKEADLQFKNISISLGMKPEIRKLGENPNALDEELYLIQHTVGILDDKLDGYRQVKQLFFEVYYDDEVRITAAAPDTELIALGGINTKAEIEVKLDGKISVPEFPVPIAGLASIAGFKGELKSDISGKIFGNIGYSFFQSKITATGIGDSDGQWKFERFDKPLLGSCSMYHTISLKKGTYSAQKKFHMAIRAKAQLSIKLINVLSQVRQTDLEEIEVLI